MDPFRSKVLEHLRAKSDWPDYLLKNFADASAIVSAIDKCLVPVIGGQRTDQPPTERGTSKVGGIPDVPEDFAWPSEDDGGPLAFVCQINLAECSADARLPHKGMLYLFSVADGDRAYGYEIDDATAKVIFVAEPGELEVATPPDDIEGEPIEERAVKLGPSFVCEHTTDDGYPVSKRFDKSVEDAIDAAIDACGGCSTGSIRMLGHAHLFRSELRSAYNPEKQALLLAVNGYAVAQDAFGEGEFHILIDRAALAKGKLGEGSVLFEPGT